MAKLNAEEKLKAVLRYVNGNESARSIANTIGVKHSILLTWVEQYKHNGEDAFLKQYTNYSVEFKLDVLKFMIENGTSLNETAAIFKIATPSTIHVWRKQLETKGIDALQLKKKGRPFMKKEQPKKVQAETSTEVLHARIKQLEMENEYLKKLNALVQSKGKLPRRTK